MDGAVDRPGSGAGASDAGRGLLAGFSAYVLWGTLPLYFALLAPAGAWEILAHRVLWSLLFCVGILVALRRPLPTWRRPALENAGLALAGVLIAVNWVTYLTAVLSGRVTDAALGYFLNPLVSVALGMTFFRERLRPLQITAVAVAATGALYLVVAAEHVPWTAFLLAVSFGVYGLVKKSLGGGVGVIEGLTVETAVLTPAAVALLVWVTLHGHGTSLTHGPAHLALLASTGIVTAVPLLLFNAAARRIPLVVVGLLQFIAPVMQFVLGLLQGEHMSPARWVGFSIVWVAVTLLVLDSLIALRRSPGATP